jgi:hypothetical protein
MTLQKPCELSSDWLDIVVQTSLRSYSLRKYVPSERLYMPASPHGLVTQKTNTDMLSDIVEFMAKPTMKISCGR